MYIRSPNRTRRCHCSPPQPRSRHERDDSDDFDDFDFNIRGDEVGFPTHRRSYTPNHTNRTSRHHSGAYQPSSISHYRNNNNNHTSISTHSTSTSISKPPILLILTATLSTKPITLNGRDYPFRKSFLDDFPKFSEKLVKYVSEPDVKKILPKEALVLLCNFVNFDCFVDGDVDVDEEEEGYDGDELGTGVGAGVGVGVSVDVDMVVMMYLLGKAVDYKSLMGYALRKLNDLIQDDESYGRGRSLEMGLEVSMEVGNKELVLMVGNVCLSEHSTEELKTWFKGWWEGVGGCLGRRLRRSWEWEGVVGDRPEVERELNVLLGVERRGEDAVAFL